MFTQLYYDIELAIEPYLDKSLLLLKEKLVNHPQLKVVIQVLTVPLNKQM